MSRVAPFGPQKCKKFVDLGGDAKGLVPSAHGCLGNTGHSGMLGTMVSPT